MTKHCPRFFRIFARQRVLLLSLIASSRKNAQSPLPAVAGLALSTSASSTPSPTIASIPTESTARIAPAVFPAAEGERSPRRGSLPDPFPALTFEPRQRALGLAKPLRSRGRPRCRDKHFASPRSSRCRSVERNSSSATFAPRVGGGADVLTCRHGGTRNRAAGQRVSLECGVKTLCAPLRVSCVRLCWITVRRGLWPASCRREGGCC